MKKIAVGYRSMAGYLKCVIRVACFSTLILVSRSQAQEPSQPPNFVLILADDLGWADLACFGNTFNETPNLDRLAAQGMRFNQFYAGPVCSPTRANIQSGLDQARFGITQHIPGHRRPFAKLADPDVPRQLPLHVLTFAERLGEAGYSTGYFGKWHLGEAGFSSKDQGWQTVVETHGNELSENRGEDSQKRRMASYLTEKATNFIEANKGRPFVLQVSHAAVHIPLSTTPSLLQKYQNKTPMKGYPSNPAYAGLLEELDQSVGGIIEAIEKAGLAQNTLVFFISDNGGIEHEQSGKIVTSNAPLHGEKGTLYEGGIRVPAIAWWPSKIQVGSVYEKPAITMDLYPTMMQLAGRSDSKQTLDGVSLVGILENPTHKLERQTLFWHLPHYHHSTPASAIRKVDWKLIEFFEDSHVELYNLKTDIGESTNLASRHPDIAEDLRKELVDWRKRVGARMPVANADYDPTRAAELGKDKTSKRKKSTEAKKTL